MPGIALMTNNGPVYTMLYCSDTLSKSRSYSSELSRGEDNTTIVPHINHMALEDFLPTIDDIQQHECAEAMMILLSNSNAMNQDM